VDALREAIAAGRYPVDAGRIADAMIAQDRGSAG
jgi:anti-sigma28 factor (negative regulator of flagellin synthesis)